MSPYGGSDIFITHIHPSLSGQRSNLQHILGWFYEPVHAKMLRMRNIIGIKVCILIDIHNL